MLLFLVCWLIPGRLIFVRCDVCFEIRLLIYLIQRWPRIKILLHRVIICVITLSKLTLNLKLLIKYIFRTERYLKVVFHRHRFKAFTKRRKTLCKYHRLGLLKVDFLVDIRNLKLVFPRNYNSFAFSRGLARRHRRRN